jgi:hypothetical protein
MKLFGRWATAEHATITEQAGIQDQDAYALLQKNFAIARKGNFFRTLAFKSIIGGDALGATHMQAVENRDTFEWTVQEITAQPNFVSDNVPAGQMLERRGKPILNVDFFEALKMLNHFELINTAQGNSPFGKTMEELGVDHVRAFAEREGIVFDVHGTPHPTQQGRIVTSGDFLPGQELQAMRNYISPGPKREWSAGALGKLFDEVSALKSLDKIVILKTEGEQWKKIIDLNKLLLSFCSLDNLGSTRRSYDRGYTRYDELCEEYFELKRKKEYHDRDTQPKLYASEAKKFKKIISNFEGLRAGLYAFYTLFNDLKVLKPAYLSDERKQFERNCAQQELLFLSYYGASLMDRFMNGKAEEAVSLKKALDRLIPRLEHTATNQGYSTDTIAGMKAAVFAGKVLPGASSNVEHFIEEYEKIYHAVCQANAMVCDKLALPPVP